MKKTINWHSTLNQINKIEGYLVPGQEKALYILASSLKENSKIVEIGSFMGKSTVCLSLGSPKTAKIYSIDTFEGNGTDFKSGDAYFGPNYYNKFKKNLKKFGVLQKMIPKIGFSQNIGKGWKMPIDLLFIDGSHIYKDVKKDFDLFYPWVKPGGIIILHDVVKEFPGVYRVWNEIVKKRLSTFGNKYSLYFGYKPSHPLSRIIDFLKMKSLEKKINYE